MFFRALALAVLLLSVISCKKKEEPTCNYKGTIVFRGTENMTGTVTGYINGVRISDFSPGSIGMYERDTGCYVLSAGGHSDTVCIKPCETAIFFIR